jgi:hypothetical protein
MKSVDRWINRFIMERFSAMETIQGLDPDFEESRGYRVSLKDLQLNDGRGLNFSDPALSLFFRFSDLSGRQEVKNLSRLIGSPGFLFNPAHAPNLDKAHLDLVHQIFALREGGWNEMDRLFKHLYGTTFTAFSDTVSSHVHFNAADPGLGGERFYKLEFLVSWEIPVVVFGSSPRLVLEQLPDVFARVQQQFLDSGRATRAIRLYSRGYEHFDLPLQQVLIDAQAPRAPGEYAKTRLEINWEGLSIGRKEHSVMLSLLKLAPESEHNRIKGEFLEDELGL